MMKIDRYALLCIAVSLVILAAALFSNEEIEDNDIIGVVFDIDESQSGFTFSFEDHEGNGMRCFTRTMPENNSVYSIRGTMSDDGTMFFVSSMILITSE